MNWNQAASEIIPDIVTHAACDLHHASLAFSLSLSYFLCWLGCFGSVMLLMPHGMPSITGTPGEQCKI